MDEKEVIQYVRSYFEKKGWKQSYLLSKYDFRADISYVKEDIRYVVEAKGDTGTNRSYQIKYAIGEVVALMHEVGEKFLYGIALPVSVAGYLSKFGLEGLKALNLHFFIVGDDGVVSHLAPQKVLEFVTNLRKRGKAYPSTLSTDP